MKGTSQLADEGIIASYFLLVKMSMAVKLHLADPCFPVLEVDTSETWSIKGRSKEARWLLIRLRG